MQWHELCKAFLVEAQWQRQGYIPSFEEYLSNGWVTSTGPLLLLHALPTITQDQHHIMNMLSNNGTAAIRYPRQVYLSSRIFRLCNDCATHKAETERGDAPSSIACYMREMGVGEEEARHRSRMCHRRNMERAEPRDRCPYRPTEHGPRLCSGHGKPLPQPCKDHPLHLLRRGWHHFAD